MFTISIFCLVEIWPIWHVLDSGFIQTFLETDYVKRINDLTEPLLSEQDLENKPHELSPSEEALFVEAQKIPDHILDSDRRGGIQKGGALRNLQIEKQVWHSEK